MVFLLIANVGLGLVAVGGSHGKHSVSSLPEETVVLFSKRFDEL